MGLGVLSLLGTVVRVWVFQARSALFDLGVQLSRAFKVHTVKHLESEETRKRAEITNKYHYSASMMILFLTSNMKCKEKKNKT